MSTQKKEPCQPLYVRVDEALRKRIETTRDEMQRKIPSANFTLSDAARALMMGDGDNDDE